MREEELRRFPWRCIECVNSLDGRVLRSNREMREAVQAHFRDRFARCPDLLVQKFRYYVANLGRRKRLVARAWLLNGNSVMH